MFDLIPQGGYLPKILVVGVGGCGCNTINQLSQAELSDSVQLVAVNTDAQSLANAQCTSRLQIGDQSTRGLGAGANPEKGLAAAKESEQAINELVEDADLVFITGGMGGGTGTGAMPFIASLVKPLGKPLVAVVTIPFAFEGEQRNRVALQGVEKLAEQANSLIVLPNDKLVAMLDEKITLVNAFNQSNRVLQDVLQGLTVTISQSGLINIDLNDFVTVISHQGRAAMGVARQQGRETLADTVAQALNNQLLEEMELSKAKGAIVSVVATEAVELNQYHAIGDLVHQHLGSQAQVIIGLSIVPELECELEIMVIATGMPGAREVSQPSERFNNAELLNITDFLKERGEPLVREEETHEISPEVYDIPSCIRPTGLRKRMKRNVTGSRQG
ncbi:cell division protein FtsZ [Shewanella insulae]|uniref:cell division protein FtsZ n=1 Tax=Shewanella insulae TaxID=2681496 RepID=UPI001EFEE9BE|nr:cell division protein FtsZ [Shewanella insulae]MCG9755438.1 cell division protein FtsZ [Shewanella insulae]